MAVKIMLSYTENCFELARIMTRLQTWLWWIPDGLSAAQTEKNEKLNHIFLWKDICLVQWFSVLVLWTPFPAYFKSSSNPSTPDPNKMSHHRAWWWADHLHQACVGEGTHLLRKPNFFSVLCVTLHCALGFLLRVRIIHFVQGTIFCNDIAKQVLV